MKAITFHYKIIIVGEIYESSSLSEKLSTEAL